MQVFIGKIIKPEHINFYFLDQLETHPGTHQKARCQWQESQQTTL